MGISEAGINRRSESSPLTSVRGVYGDEEGVCCALVLQVAKGEAETVVTFDLQHLLVLVPQSVLVHVVLREVETRRQRWRPALRCLQGVEPRSKFCLRPPIPDFLTHLE